MDQAKADFIQEGFLSLLAGLSPNTEALWGKMNAQQMVEHVTGFFLVSIGEMRFPLVTPEEHLPKFKEFLLSEKQFRENTKAPVLPEEPLPVREPDLASAIQQLRTVIESFFTYFSNDPDKKTMHPVFGWLNFEEWVLLHYKHVTHHARQFGLLGKP
ncbi:MAG TPA: hypothetical protein DHW64_10185 [Chitinophagaceae bacterium]|jgi:hypothetical protein|nr:hypothetical protein [Chitinophagaceae bacterium]